MDHENSLELMDLLAGIIREYRDGNCRPAHEIALYEKYLDLRQSHNAQLTGRLIAIPGGLTSMPPAAKGRSTRVAIASGARKNANSGVTFRRHL